VTDLTENPQLADFPVSDAEDVFGAEVQTAETSTNMRVPVILLVDTSGSMAGAPIKALNAALQDFQTAFDVDAGGDAEAARSGELALITFGDGGVKIHNLRTGSGTADLQSAFVEGTQFRAPTLKAGGGTPMGQAMTLALQCLEARKQFYRDPANAIPYYRPMIFLISDGAPDSGWEASAAEAVQQVQSGKALIFPIGVQGADLPTLGKFSTTPALPLSGLKFTELFRFISNSIGRVSSNAPGTQTTALDPALLESWLQVPVSHD
jgi:uncharacterized protein YegL